MSVEGLARASCAIYVDGRREGTGTLVTNNHVLTAAHVVRHGGSLTMRFRDGLLGEAIPVERLPLGADAEELDIAVLKVGCGRDKPPRAELWPAKRLPMEMKAFGYPKSETAAPRGVWRDSTVGGTVRGGTVQLDWAEVGTLEGQSGGPVCDRLSGRMVGVLVEGSEAGHFDRMVPLPAIRRMWDGLPRPWLFAGEGGRTHFTQPAAGQRSIARGGDLFRGRGKALAIVGGWMSATVGAGLPLVITAQPGAGKSAVIARAALGIERNGQCDGLVFHARRAVVAEFVDAVSAAYGLDTPASWQELVAALAAQEAQDVMVVAVDALDEAASDQDRADLRRALRELARLSWLRVVVATRPLTAGDRHRSGTLLYGLGVTREESANLVDLDADRYFAAEGLIAYADALLAQDGFANPGPSECAWEYYRQNAGARTRLARVVADRAGRNYLVAGMSAFQLAEDAKIVDPASALFDPSIVPSGIDEALNKYLDRLPSQRRRHEVGLLTALAYGRGPGLDDQRWLAFAWALGYDDVTTGDLVQLKASAAADYLLETSTEPDGLVTRLFHQALADELVTNRDRRDDEVRLVALLQTDRGWLASSRYARNYAPSHMAEAGVLQHFVGDADFLVSMSPTAMRSALRGLARSTRQNPVSIYDVALPFLCDEPGVNATILELVSQIHGNGALSKELGEVSVNRPYAVTGNIRPFDRALSRFDGHTDRVQGVASLEWPGRDYPVIVTVSRDETARVWDPRDPDRELARFDGHTDWVMGVATLPWRGLDYKMIVTVSRDGTARVWDPRHPDRELARFDRHTDWVMGVATLPWPGLNYQVIVTVSRDGTARVWDPRHPDRELARFDGHTDWVIGVATLAWPGLDHPVIVTVSRDGTARVWDPRHPDRELARFDGHTFWVQGVATLAWPGLDHPVIVTVSDDGTARVWDPRDPGRELARFNGHASWVWGVATLAWPGLDHPVIVTTSDDATAHVWDPRDPDHDLARFDGHTGGVWGVAALEWPGLDHPVIVTASNDGTARVWDPHDPGRKAVRNDGLAGGVWGVAVLEWPGLDHPVIVTASVDGTARVWDARDPDRELSRFDGHTERVWTVATLEWPGLDHPVIVTTSHDATARVWDPHDPDRELARFNGHTSWIAGVATLAWPGLDHPVIVTTSGDGTARVWDPHDPDRELARFDGHTDWVEGVATLAWPGLDHPVIVTTSGDGTARVWDPRDPDQELARFDGHTDWVIGVATLAWPGLDHPVIVTTSGDGTARVWDPRDPRHELARHTGVVTGVAALEWPGLDHPVIVIASSDGAGRIWDPRQPHSELGRLAFLGEVNSIAVFNRTTLAVGCSRGFLVFELKADQSQSEQLQRHSGGRYASR